MTKLLVNEIFYSIQGEGARTGYPSLFIRLAKCNLTCGFCDTEFESYKEMTLEEIYSVISLSKGTTIVWTGGEPALHLTSEIVDWFKNKGYRQTIETNGSLPVPDNLDFVSISPKVAEHVLAKNFPSSYTGKRELRYVRHKGQSIPRPAIKADYYFISPLFNGDQSDEENIRHCLNLVKENPQWALSIQLHKFIKVL